MSSKKPNLNDTSVLDKEINAPKTKGQLKSPTVVERLQAIMQIKLIRSYVLVLIFTLLLLIAGLIFVYGFSTHTNDDSKASSSQY